MLIHETYVQSCSMVHKENSFSHKVTFLAQSLRRIKRNKDMTSRILLYLTTEIQTMLSKTSNLKLSVNNDHKVVIAWPELLQQVITTYSPSLKNSFKVLLKLREYLTNSFLRISRF